MNLLKSLIGKTLISIDAPRHLKKLDGASFNCIEEIYLSFKEVDGYVKLLAQFDETNFGDDFMTFKITKVQSIEKVEQIGKPLPMLSYPMSQDFVINKIEVYGESYQTYSKNNRENSLWDIEVRHPRQSINENVENENIFLFYASNEKLLIRAFNAFEIVEFTFNDGLIQSFLSQQNLEGNLITKLKQSINEYHVMTDFNITQFSEADKNRWRNERWEKHGVLKLLHKDGFKFIPDGRSGYIYCIEQGTLVEIYVEMSGVKEYDMLIYFDEKLERFPNGSFLNKEEREIFKCKLLAWLDKKSIRSDLAIQ